jgi:hypothetical protein
LIATWYYIIINSMSYSPFDGVLLDDLRAPIPGALAMVLHLQIAARQSSLPSQDAVESRAAACRELLEHGLFPKMLRGLAKHGLELGHAKDPHSLNSVVDHLEQYLEAVSSAGYIEPPKALWDAVDSEMGGKRGMWVERTSKDGPIEATLKDLQPARLRALACLPQLGGALFRLATRRGGSSSGLFGSSQPLADWFLDGLEAHGHAFAADIQLAEPVGWGSALWADALDPLFEAPLKLGGHQKYFQRCLVDSPWDLLRHAVEQAAAWAAQGIEAKEIALVHPAPEKIRGFLETLLRAEGLSINSSTSLCPLIQSQIWSPIWSFFEGLAHLDPCAVARGLLSSKRPEIREWAEVLSASDQSGNRPFEESFEYLQKHSKHQIISLWQVLQKLRPEKLYPHEWADCIHHLITSQLRFPLDSDDFFAPFGLLKEIWHKLHFSNTVSKKRWDFDYMLRSLKSFLESARSANAPNAPNGVRLISPQEVLDAWDGAAATLVMDLSEGAWPAMPAPNPDLDWARRASINSALALATRDYDGVFPPALQRFWLPRAEHTDQIPRTFQRDAYAFNKMLATTRQCFVALSPAQDQAGRKLAQGPFWSAIEGAGQWGADPANCFSFLRSAWDGAQRSELADSRSKSAQAKGAGARFESAAPDSDLAPNIRQALQNHTLHISPTVLESLARCPFRTIAERVWRLGEDETASAVAKNVGIIVHRLLQAMFQPVLDAPDWPGAFAAHYKAPDTRIAVLEGLVSGLWEKNMNEWITGKTGPTSDQKRQIKEQIESLLPNIAAYLRNDLEDACPTNAELALLFPAKFKLNPKSNSKHALTEGWNKTITGLEHRLGPLDLRDADGKTISVSGIVDRIELWKNDAEKLSFFRITDYKTSARHSLYPFSADDAPFGSHLQTPLYMWMAMEAFKKPAASVLIPLRDPNPKPFANHLVRLAECNQSGNGWQPELAKTLSCLDARIEIGDYPPTPGSHCQYCKYDALCMRPVDVAGSEGEDDAHIGTNE